MPNMPHCRFENTLSDLADCLNNFDNIQSQRELHSAKDLVGLCRQIVDDFEDQDILISPELCEDCREELEKCKC